MTFNFTSAHNDYLDPDKNIEGWADEAFEIKVSTELKEGELIKIDDEYFEVINTLNNNEYVITDTRKKDDSSVEHFLNEHEVIFL